MDEQLLGLPREEVIFQRMKDFHLQRVSAIEKGDVPLKQRDGGILVLHLIPESCVFGRSSFDGSTLKEQGTRLRPLGDSGGYTRFNVDGFLNYSGYQVVRGYSQLFRDGRLENVMSDVGYPVNHQSKNSAYAIRHGLIERAVFNSISEYRQFCQAVQTEPPVWLFSALVECKGYRMATGRLRDLSEQAVDRSPAFLPELVIDDFRPPIEQQLRPWCDNFWQASGLERSFNYDQEGNWHEPR
jgi:hypothetical protein